jgi:K+-sensing histidine kinase KdpD
MNKRSIINKSIILLVFIAGGFLLARSLYYGSLIGIVCALIGIAAWTMFLYKLSTIQSAENNPEEIQENY